MNRVHQEEGQPKVDEGRQPTGCPCKSISSKAKLFGSSNTGVIKRACTICNISRNSKKFRIREVVRHRADVRRGLRNGVKSPLPYGTYEEQQQHKEQLLTVAEAVADSSSRCSRQQQQLVRADSIVRAAAAEVGGGRRQWQAATAGGGRTAAAATGSRHRGRPAWPCLPKSGRGSGGWGCRRHEEPAPARRATRRRRPSRRRPPWRSSYSRGRAPRRSSRSRGRAPR